MVVQGNFLKLYYQTKTKIGSIENTEIWNCQKHVPGTRNEKIMIFFPRNTPFVQLKCLQQVFSEKAFRAISLDIKVKVWVSVGV